MTRITCDVLVIGSGAAGGVLAATLGETGKRVVLLEKGGHYTKDFFNQREWDATVLYAGRGARSTFDGDIVVRGGECVGGGTTVNYALAMRSRRGRVGRLAPVARIDGLLVRSVGLRLRRSRGSTWRPA